MIINSYAFSQLMIELGCVRQIDMQNDITTEFKMIEEIWLCLLEGIKSIPPQMVQVGDVKLFLMAIFGVSGNKRLGLDKPHITERTQDLPYGWVDGND